MKTGKEILLHIIKQNGHCRGMRQDVECVSCPLTKECEEITDTAYKEYTLDPDWKSVYPWDRTDAVGVEWSKKIYRIFYEHAVNKYLELYGVESLVEEMM